MKILRSKGNSYTELDHADDSDKAELGRGLVPNSDKILTAPAYLNGAVVEPGNLVSFVGEDYALVLRQTISVLDKVIRKPRDLRYFNLEAYVDRTHLSKQLWEKICKKCEGGILELPNGKEAFEVFEKTWLWKVHPYAISTCNFAEPRLTREDKNAKYIIAEAKKIKEKLPEKEAAIRADFEGRWHKVFWETLGKKPNYAATAKAIWDHLWKQELTIFGKPRQEFDEGNGRDSGVGLISHRAQTMVTSVNDPRSGKRALAEKAWCGHHEKKYFKSDVAKKIHDNILTMHGKGEQFFASTLGEMVHAHFGKLKSVAPTEKDDRFRWWALHNKVRQFYQKLGKSERFRIAYRAEGIDELQKLLPADSKKLLEIIDAKKRNASTSELIRLGKLIVHASEMPSDTENLDEKFKKRMDYFATSEGQSEIKRNEAFTRVWRNSVGLSIRTLKAWVDPDVPTETRNNDDITEKNLSVFVANSLNSEHFNQHLNLIFGNKTFPECGDQSRASLFQSQSDAQAKETAWTMLRLASQLRHRTNHFNTKTRLVNILTGGVLTEKNLREGMGFANRKNDQVHDGALKPLKDLLDFDSAVYKQIFVDDLNRLQVKKYLDDDQIGFVITECFELSNSASISPPKFISVLGRAQSLAEFDKSLVPDKAKPFLKLNLKQIAKNSNGAENCQLGLLRQLYASGFHRWLANENNIKKELNSAIRFVTDSLKKRKLMNHKEKGLEYAFAQSVFDDFAASEINDLDRFFRILHSKGMDAEHMNKTYKARDKDQQRLSNNVEKFKQEVFSQLFGVYLDDPKLCWIWNLPEVKETDKEPKPLLIADIENTNVSFKENWHSQFYAWLYLVPVDDISLLRHQFRKTAVLEGKAKAEIDERLGRTLVELDKLMSLYMRVQSAGFSGEEHVPNDEAKALFYEKQECFGKVYSGDLEEQHLRFPGTRRGLRQIQRFGHTEVLKKIFEKHRVTDKEAEIFAQLGSEKTKNLFKQKNDIRTSILELIETNDKKVSDAVIKEKCDRYKDLAASTALYDFGANAARLTEHARLHQLLMRIVGRLMDFTLMWERDSNYLFLALLYTQNKESGGLTLVGDALPDEALGVGFDLAEYDSESPAEFRPLWNDNDGFCLPKFSTIQPLLKPSYLALFNAYFYKLDHQNQKDFEWHKKLDSENKSHRKYNSEVTKRDIRNDFAHYNVIGKKKGYLNLTYLINAVRSLFGHDRKLKNAVSKAIREIVEKEGMVINWEMKHDRLKNAEIRPGVVSHLSMLKSAEFKLPKTSVRYTSMVKALFDFDNGGYRQLVGPSGSKSREGTLEYPDTFRRDYKEHIPSKMWDIYPMLGL